MVSFDPVSLRRHARDAVWGDRFEEATVFVRWPLMALRLALAVLRDLGEGGLRLHATSLVYTTLLSLAPLLAISFSVLKGFGVHNQIEPFLVQLLEPLGEQGRDITARIIGFVDNIQVGVLGVVGIALLVYSVIALMHKIETAFNDVWRVPNARSYARRVRDYLGVLLIGPFLIFLSVGMTSALRHADLVREWLDIDIVNSAFEGVFLVVPYVLFMLAFAALYVFMPNTRVRAVPALLAGLMTGIVWKFLGKLFGIFVAGSASYAAVYSAFAALILFMIWLYIGWLIVLAGASVCYYLQNPTNLSMPRRSKPIDAFSRQKLALHVVAAVGESFYGEGRGLTLRQLAQTVHVPAAVIDDMVDTLMRAGIVATVDDTVTRLVPARPFDETSVDDMLSALQQADSAQALHNGTYAPAAVLRTLEIAAAARQKALGGMTLKQLSLGSID